MTTTATRQHTDPESMAMVEGVVKSYFRPDGTIHVQALDGIDVDIPRGQYVAIMGASGSGKSTLMNILGCLDRPTSGKYFLDGDDVSALDDDAISIIRGQRIGFVFQAFNLISELTILENVAVPLFYQGIPRALRCERAREVLASVGLEDRLSHRPSQLSGGEQQRVAVARALVSSPSVIMADEPTGNLDTATGNRLLEIFDSLHADGMTIIVITHDHEVAVRCQRIITLRDGRIESDTLTSDK